MWAGVEVVRAGDGEWTLALAARADLVQHAGFLHAAVQAGLIDRACGFAAASIAGNVRTSQFQLMCYAPAVGERFEARAKVSRAGRKQLFVTAELFALQGDNEKLVAGGSAVLMVLQKVASYWPSLGPGRSAVDLGPVGELLVGQFVSGQGQKRDYSDRIV